MPQFAVNNFKFGKYGNVDVTALSSYGVYHSITLIKIIQLQTDIMVNCDIAQKNCFHFHNLDFMLNLIIKIIHTSGRVYLELRRFPRKYAVLINRARKLNTGSISLLSPCSNLE